ncbi:MAG: hypothetical protein ABIF88_02635 [archaeon]
MINCLASDEERFDPDLIGDDARLRELLAKVDKKYYQRIHDAGIPPIASEETLIKIGAQRNENDFLVERNGARFFYEVRNRETDCGLYSRSFWLNISS